jgi:hypothetical protein
LRKTPIFSPKMVKIARNCDHNIDPWFGEFSPVERLFTRTDFRKLQKEPEFLGYYFTLLNLCIKSDNKRSGLHFGRFFSRTHLVTLFLDCFMMSLLCVPFIEILDLEDACWKNEQIFSSWSPPYFVKWREVLYRAEKLFWKTCIGWRSANFFTRCSFPKNICKIFANILVLDLRFLWYLSACFAQKSMFHDSPFYHRP